MAKANQQQDIGFGNKGGGSASRLIKDNGQFNVRRIGSSGHHLYLELIEMGWAKFWYIVLGFYFFLNVLFALLFAVMGNNQIRGVPEMEFLDRFIQYYFFCIQTFTTVGYGAMSPNTFFANVVSSFISFLGLMTFAIITGFLFARLAKPTSFIRYSRQLILAPYNNGKAVMFRMVSTRDTTLSDIKVALILTWLRVIDGVEKREYHNLALERDSVALFPLNWTLVHVYNEDSPLYGFTPEEFEALHAEILIDVKGYDETFNQQVRSRNSYVLNEMERDVKFTPMYHNNDEGLFILELEKVSDVVSVIQT